MKKLEKARLIDKICETIMEVYKKKSYQEQEKVVNFLNDILLKIEKV